jgi:hypothetical protein
MSLYLALFRVMAYGPKGRELPKKWALRGCGG